MTFVSARAIEAAHLVDRLERLARGGDGGGLNPAQWEALRYLARANRFSRSPAALADYLASTRGTVSQTLIALEGRGLVSRRPSKRDGRAIEVWLTADGERVLADDPILALAADLEQSAGAGLDQLVEALAATLRRAIERNHGRAFGACHTCRHFRRGVRGAGASPHQCALLDEPLSDGDSAAICMEHNAAV